MPPLYSPEIDALLELIQQTGQLPQQQAPVALPSPNTFRIGQGPAQTLDERPIGDNFSEQFPGGGSFTALPAGQAGLFGGPEGILGIKQPDPQMVARGRAIQQRETSEAGLMRLREFVSTPQGKLLFEHLGKLDPGIQATMVGRLMGQPEGGITTKAQREMEQFQTKERFKAGLRGEAEQRKKAAKTIAEDRGYHWLDPNTGEPLASDTTIVEANRVKAKRVNQQQFNTAQSALNGLQLLTDYESLAKRLPYAKQPSIPGVVGAGLTIGYMRARREPIIAELDSLSTSITQLAQAFGGDRRITKEERALLFQAVPKDYESVPSAIQRIETTRKALLGIAKRLDIPVPQELRGEVEAAGPGVPVKGKQPTPTQAPTAGLPPAGQHKNRVIRDTQTGQRLMSNGTSWVPLR